jgi:WD40 repeat protein
VLAVAIRRLMAKRPEDRYQSAAALVAALDDNAVGTMPALDLQATPVASPAPVAVPIAVPAPPVMEPAIIQALPQAVAVVSTAETPPSLPGVPDRKRRRRLLVAAAGGVGLLVLVGLILLLARSGKTATTAKEVAGKASNNKPLTREQQADTEFLALLTRFGDRKADAEALRRDLLVFRQTYADLPVAVQAAEKVTRLPSPLDQLPGRIPPEERFEGRPKQLVAVLGERRWRHWGQVYALAMSPDAQTVASGGQDGVRLWNARSGQEQTTLESPWVVAIAYSADGKRLVSLASDGTGTSWDLGAEKKIDPVAGPLLKGATAFTLSGDGMLAAAVLPDGFIKVWNATTGKEVATLRNGAPASTLAFAPDGNTLASAGADKAIHLWSLASGLERGKLVGHGSPVRALAFSADGQALASGGDDNEIRVWDLVSKKTRTTLVGHQTPVSALVFVRDDKILASGDTSGTVRLWRQGSNREPVLRGHTAAITALAARRQGSVVVSASLDGSLRAWDLVGDEEASPLAGHAGIALAVAFSPDCKLVATGSSDATVKLWDVPGLKDKTLRGHTNWVRALSFSGDGQRLASGGWDGLVKLWDPGTGIEKTTLAPHRGQVNSVAYSLDGHLLAAGSWASEPHPARGTNIDVGEVKLWEVPANRDRASMRTSHHHGVSSVALAANGKIGASGGWDGTVRLWEAPSGRDRGTLEVGLPVECVAFSPSGAILAAGCRNPNGQNGQIRLWDVASQKPRNAYTAGYTGMVTGLAFSPDGHLLAGSDSDGNIIVWDLVSSTQHDAWKVPGAVLGVAFASDGRHIATANANSTIHIFRLKTYQPRW